MQREYNNPYGDFATNVAFLQTIVKQAEKRRAKMTPEELEVERVETEERNKQYNINKHINQGVCPDCKSKLVRGKKDKNNNYRRTWTCSECDNKFMR